MRDKRIPFPIRRRTSKKFFKKTIDKFKILCYNLVTKLRQELNKIKIGRDLPQKENF